MLKRKIYQDLLQWKRERKNEQLKKCLIIKGARQVGKSFIVKEFGNNEYASFINIDFYREPLLKEIFDGDLTANEILKRMSAYIPNFNLVEGNTLVFLDEIQCCGNARTAIKYLAEDFRVDVIASGSLLGLTYGEDDENYVEIPKSIPVGYEIPLIMFSLDFEEFLWALGYNEEALNTIKTYFDTGNTIGDALHTKYTELFREFMVVGGMPEVVNDFSINRDFSRVYKIQKQIINEYYDDISKHAKGREKQNVRMCYDAVPKQLAKELKKFQYSTVESGQTRRKYGGSVQWLKDSSIVNICYNIREPYLPLIGNANDNEFKLYFNDTGLLSAIYGFETKLAILNGSIKGNVAGGIYENIIAECLIKKGYLLYYYKPDTEHEIEFLLEKDQTIIPVEVKASNGSTKSLNFYQDKYEPKIVYKLISGKNGFVNSKYTIPHYMVMFL